VLGRHGITRIEAAGEAFDPTRHEAISSEHAPEIEPNRVVRQFLPGYALHDRVVRPAKVSVSTKPPVESPSSDD
jgi:molecular chaperone GrpE